MTREELIKYCRYYKGEDVCPFEINANKRAFWTIEKQYIFYATEDDTWHEYWENSAMNFIKKNPDNKSVIRTKDFTKETKGIYMYVCQMIAKWMPYDETIYDEY